MRKKIPVLIFPIGNSNKAYTYPPETIGPRETESRNTGSVSKPVAPAMEVFFPTLLSYMLVVAPTMWNRVRAESKARGPGRARQKSRPAGRAEKYGPRTTMRRVNKFLESQ